MSSLLMNARRCAVWNSVVPWICAGLFCITATTGCASGPQPTDTGEDKKKKKREPQAPNPEELASSPCGNPEWGTLPEEHAIDGDPAPSETENSEPDTDRPDNEAGGETDSPADGSEETDDPVDDEPTDGGDE